MDDGDTLDRFAEAPAAAAAAAAAGSGTLDPVETYSFNTGDSQKAHGRAATCMTFHCQEVLPEGGMGT